MEFCHGRDRGMVRSEKFGLYGKILTSSGNLFEIDMNWVETDANDHLSEISGARRTFQVEQGDATDSQYNLTWLA